MKKEIKLIAFDADDTLWINEPHYRNSEKELQKLLSKYIDVENIGERIYEFEKKNLSIFGYGAKGFTLSMIETAIELSNHKITSTEIQEIIDIGKELIQYPIEVLPKIENVLGNLSKKFPLMVLTKGDLIDQESKIARSGLSQYFDYIEIVSEKDEETYSQLFAKHDLSPNEILMIGNSAKSDIIPILNIGGDALHLPFGDKTWVHEQIDTSDYVFETFDSIEKIYNYILENYRF